MVNKIEYIILDNKCLIIESYRGNFNVDDLIEFKKKMGNDTIYNPNFNVIHDFRKAEFLFDIDEISKYAEKKNNLIYKKGYDTLRKCHKKETIIVHHLINIVRRAWDIEGPLISLKL